MPPQVSILIPNWNGQAFLERCLAGTLRSARAAGLSFELVVVDDASTDSSAEIISSRFPNVTLIRNPVNLGFGATVNLGARIACGDILLLLNNDLVPMEPMVGELASPLLQDDHLFGVTGKVFEWDGIAHNHLRMHARWNEGSLQLTWSDPDQPEPTMFLLGGCMAVRRREFLRLGGFSHLFAPGYWEDYDLSYLALKCGWKNLYTPYAQACHFGQASMKRAFGARHLSAIRERNSFLFTWLNLTDPDYLREHSRSLPRVVALPLVDRDPATRVRARGLLSAAACTGSVARERRRRMPMLRRTDRDVLVDFAAAGMPVQVREAT